MSGLQVQDLRRDGLAPASLQIQPGETLCLHGPSGSGKTLLLRAIADLDPNQGEVSLDGLHRSQIPAHQWRGMVMYSPPESSWWADRVGPHAEDWPVELLQAVGMDAGVLDWEVSRLSSGERQRLALVRALARTPRALLLDEPTANLDETNTLAMEHLITRYQETHAAPILWVSHDAAQRARIGARDAHIEKGVLQT